VKNGKTVDIQARALQRYRDLGYREPAAKGWWRSERVKENMRRETHEMVPVTQSDDGVGVILVVESEVRITRV
jgi:hypothetical protein